MAGTEPPAELRGAEGIDLGYATEFHILLGAIDEAMPVDATLYLEGTQIAPPVARYLRERDLVLQREIATESTRGVDAFRLPLADRALRGLRDIAENHLRFEVASHLAVYRGDETLLWAHDAGDGIVTLATSLADETIERFGAALGASLKRPKRRTWLWSRPRDH
jgi:hypothetical protein